MSRDISDDETVIVPKDGDPLIGKTIGNYKVLAVLGRGGFGSVYKAKDFKLGRVVALKFLTRATEDFHAELFEREAKALGALGKHGNIVQIHAWDEYEGKNFFVLEYMPLSAADLLKQYPEGMPVELATRIIAECADGLAFAHNAEILHRDIKAQNILLESGDGAAKIADFGLARICGTSSNTIEGSAIGSPAYMAPEQARGHQLTHLCDIYSLGVTLYELLSGKHSVSGTSVLEVLERVKNNDRIPLREQKPDLPEALYAIVDKATAAEPENRYQSATEMAEALRDLEGVHIPPARSTSSGGIGKRVAVAVALVIVGGGAYAMFGMEDATAPNMDESEFVASPDPIIEPPALEELEPEIAVAEEPPPPEPESPVVAEEVEPEPTLTEQAKEAAKEEGEKILREKAEDVVQEGKQAITDTIKDILTGGDSGGGKGGGPDKGGNPGKGKGKPKKK